MKMRVSFFIFTFFFAVFCFSVQANLYTEQELQIIQKARSIWKEKKRRANEKAGKRRCCCKLLFHYTHGQKYAMLTLGLLNFIETLGESTKNFKTRKEWSVFNNRAKVFQYPWQVSVRGLVVDELTQKALHIILEKQLADYRDDVAKESARKRHAKTLRFYESSWSVINEFRESQIDRIGFIKKVLANSKKAQQTVKRPE